MRIHLYITINLLLLLLTACGASKRTQTNAVSRSQDTVKTQAVQHTADTVYRERIREVHDTIIGKPAQKLTDTVKAADTEVPKTKSGNGVPRKFSKKENGLSIWATIFPDGSLVYGAESDSLTWVVQNLQRSYDSLNNVHSHEAADTTYRSHDQAVWYSSTIVKVKSFWGAHWMIIVAAVVIAILVIIYRRVKKQYGGQ